MQWVSFMMFSLSFDKSVENKACQLPAFSPSTPCIIPNGPHVYYFLLLFLLSLVLEPPCPGPALLILVIPRLGSKAIPSTTLPILPVVGHLSSVGPTLHFSHFSPIPLKEAAIFHIYPNI